MPQPLAPLLVLVAAAVAAVPAVAQWKQYGWDAGKTFANTKETTLSRDNVGQLRVLWRSALDRYNAGQVMQAGGQLFVCSTDGLQALSPADGRKTWLVPRPDGMLPCSEPVLANDTVYFTNSSAEMVNRLTALDQATGAVKYQIETQSGVAYSGYSTRPAYRGGRLYISTKAGPTLGYKAADGSFRWEAPIGDGLESFDAAANDDMVYVATNDPRPGCQLLCPSNPARVYAFDAKSGEQRWTQTLRGGYAIRDNTMVMGTRVFVQDSSLSVTVWAMDAATGKRLWDSGSEPVYGPSQHPLVGSGGDMVYVTTSRAEGDTVNALDAETGKLRWTVELGVSDIIEANGVWANGVLYVFVVDARDIEKPRILALDADTGSTLAEVPVNAGGFPYGSNLSVTDGRVYLTAYGVIHALGL